jgi:hypothetical protein
MIDHRLVKLGKHAPVKDRRRLRLARYFTSALAPAPSVKSWLKGITSWGMMLNDTLGICTLAGGGHAVQVWTLNSKPAMVTPPDSALLADYEAWAGYNPSDSSTDQGADESSILNNWRKSPLFGSDLLAAYADVDVSDVANTLQAINLFGLIYIGLALPLTAQNQPVWDVVAGAGSDSVPGSWGGHCVIVPAYKTIDALHTLYTAITWGENQPMTSAFMQEYCDEIHVLRNTDFLNAQGDTPDGLDLATWDADLTLVGSQEA